MKLKSNNKQEEDRRTRERKLTKSFLTKDKNKIFFTSTITSQYINICLLSQKIYGIHSDVLWENKGLLIDVLIWCFSTILKIIGKPISHKRFRQNTFILNYKDWKWRWLFSILLMSLNPGLPFRVTMLQSEIWLTQSLMHLTSLFPSGTYFTSTDVFKIIKW